MKLNLDSPFNRRKTPTEKEKILPFDVRYALKHKEGILNTEDLKTLAQNGFENEALSMTLKSLAEIPEEHRALLEKYITYYFENKSKATLEQNPTKEFVTETLSTMKDLSVDGKKLAQISRQGFDLWEKKFESFAKELSAEKENIFVLANAMFIGLNPFLQAFSERHKKLNIIIPEWIENENIGYVITFNGHEVHVDWLNQSIDDKTDSIIVDDTENTGKTLAIIKKFLVKNGSENVRTRVIDKVV